MSAFPAYKIKKIIPANDWFGLFINDDTNEISTLRVIYFAECIFFDGYMSETHGEMDNYQLQDFVKLNKLEILADCFMEIYVKVVGFSSYWEWEITEDSQWESQESKPQITADYNWEYFKGYYHKDDLENIKKVLIEQNKNDN